MGVGGWLDYVKLRLAKASQLSWSWGLAWLSLAIMSFIVATNVVASRPPDWNADRSCQFIQRGSSSVKVTEENYIILSHSYFFQVVLLLSNARTKLYEEKC